jgi:sugar lactone lactonase YvrE/cytoskeletal protein CcmA (bactofilin family)
MLSLFALLLCAPLALAQGKMYWTDPNSGEIHRANLDGSNIQNLVMALDGPTDIALDVNASKMYWTVENDGKIQRANLDGTGTQDIVTGITPPFPSTLALDLAAGKLYWAESDRIRRANFDGSGSEDVLTGLSVIDDLALDPAGGKMYWIESFDIRRANLDGTGLENLVSGLGNGHGIALHVGGGKMYWTDEDDEKIQRANLDGTSVEDLITGLMDNPQGIALDVFEGKLYWTDEGTAQIHRANLDGTSIEDLVTGTSTSIGIALDVAASPNARFVQFSGPGGFVVSRSKLVSQGNIFSNANLHFQKGDPTVFNGNLFAVGNIIIDKDNVINGNLRAGGTITIDPKSTVNGTIHPSDPMQPSDPMIPGDPFCFPGDPGMVINIGKGQSRTLAPSDPCKQPTDPMYDVNVGNSATLNLSSGTYVFSELETQSESVINFDVSNGAVVLHVHDKLALGKKVQFNISPGGQANSQLVTIFAFQSSKVAVDKGGYLLGNLNAPNAEVSLGKNVSLRGAVGADKVSVDRDVIFLHHSSSSVLPKQVLFDEEKASDQSSVTSYQLAQNYPNPFSQIPRFAGNPSTVIRFQLPVSGEVKLVIYNATGQLVRTLYSGEMPAGRFSVEWDGKNESGERVASGVYVYEMRAGEFVAQRKLVLMR